MVLAAAAHQVVAVDIDPDVLTRARLMADQFGGEFAERIRFLLADGMSLPFEDD